MSSLSYKIPNLMAQHSEKQAQDAKQTSTSQSVSGSSSATNNVEIATVNTRLAKILAQIGQLFIKEEWSEAIKRLTDLAKNMKFLKSIGKCFDARFQIICYYNLGCAYQAIAFQQNNQTAIQNCIDNLDLANSLLNQEDLLSDSNIKLKIFKVKILLQYCALLSQLENHELAFEFGKKALLIIKDMFKTSKKACQIQLKNLKSKSDNKNSTFAINLLTTCLQQIKILASIQTVEEMSNIDNKYFQKIRDNSFFWKDNFENNCKAFKKQMNKLNENQKNSPSSPGLSSGRNFLGRKIDNNWITQLSIAQIMKMMPISYEQLSESDNVASQFTARSLIQKGILSSVVYFTISTEMRFLQQIELQKEKEKLHFQPPRQKSELLHFKSIELICQYIKQDCPLVDHLINSYLKHYKNCLASIEQKSSFFEYSQIFGEVKKSCIIMKNNQIQGQFLHNNFMNELNEDFFHQDIQKNVKKSQNVKPSKGGLTGSKQLPKYLTKSVEFNKRGNKQKVFLAKTDKSGKLLSFSLKLKATKVKDSKEKQINPQVRKSSKSPKKARDHSIPLLSRKI